MPEHPRPARIVTRQIEKWEGQTHHFRMAARAAAPEQQLAEGFLWTDEAWRKFAGGFVGDQFLCFPNIAPDSDRHRMSDRTVSFKQFDHRGVAALVSPRDRRLADVRFRVRVCAALEQSLRDRQPAPVGALVERTSPAFAIGAFDGSAFVGMETKVEKKFGHIEPVVHGSDLEQAAVCAIALHCRWIRKLTFGVSFAEPF